VALIKSISGIRGTIGGKPGEALTPPDIVRYTAAFGTITGKGKKKRRMVVGRDARVSGEMVQGLVIHTLRSIGVDVTDLGITTTPTVEIAVKNEKADGGIIITASHNPKEWNALKLLNAEGEFISAETGVALLELADTGDLVFETIDKLGSITRDDTYLQRHVEAVVNYPLVNVKGIASQHLRVIVDGINSSGALYIPELLKALGVEEVILLNGEMNGQFAHNPEPLPEHLEELSREVVRHKAHLGIAVDPDVDRLCFVCEDGSMFGEEYTLVAVADYVLSKRKGNTVSNLSSTRALMEVTGKHGGEYFPSPVGEVNVVKKMKVVDAVIGGEGNGGVIVPDFHYGRDALIGIGLFLSHLSNHLMGARSLRRLYPDYYISKNKVGLDNGIDAQVILDHIKDKYQKHPMNLEDGLKIDFDKDWVHLRTSNTEPIIRVYAESSFETTANSIALKLIKDIKELMK